MARMRRDIVVGQVVTEEKMLFAKQLRTTMTPSEQILWEQLRNRKLASLKFRRQQVIDGFIADFYCAEAGVVIELDGASHDGFAEADAKRDRIIAAHNLLVLRFTNVRIEQELGQVLDEIGQTCASRLASSEAKRTADSRC